MMLSNGDLVSINKPLTPRLAWLHPDVKEKFEGKVLAVVKAVEASEEGSWVSYYIVESEGGLRMDFLVSEVEPAFTV